MPNYEELCPITPILLWESTSQIYPTIVRYWKFSSLTSTTTITLNHPQILLSTPAMTTSNLSQYIGTFYIWESSIPELAIIIHPPQAQNIFSGSFILLRPSLDPNRPSFGTQVGSIIGCYGQYAIMEVLESGLPHLQFIAIPTDWIKRDRFNWDPNYYIWLGGLQFDNYFLPLQPFMWNST